MSLQALSLLFLSSTFCLLANCEILLCMCHFYYSVHLQLSQPHQTFTLTFATPFTNFPTFAFCKQYPMKISREAAFRTTSLALPMTKMLRC